MIEKVQAFIFNVAQGFTAPLTQQKLQCVNLDLSMLTPLKKEKIVFFVDSENAQFVVGKIILGKTMEHWNYHPMRKGLVYTHTTEQSQEDLFKEVQATFKSLRRLYEKQDEPNAD